MIIKNIEILGDSLARGVIWCEIAGKYKLVKESAANMFGPSNEVSVKNYSKFGCTTEKALRLLPGILEKSGPEKGIVLLELGGNDCDFNWDEISQNPGAAHKPNVSFIDFKKNIAAIIEQILAAGKRPVIMTLPPIDSDKYFEWISKGCKERAANLMTFLGDKNLIYRHQELYAAALEKIALKYNLYIVPVRETLLKVHKYSDYLCLDGIHLNIQGQAIIKAVCDQTYREYLSLQAA